MVRERKTAAVRQQPRTTGDQMLINNDQTVDEDYNHIIINDCRLFWHRSLLIVINHRHGHIVDDDQIDDYDADYVGTVADHTESGGFPRFINCRTEPAVVNLPDERDLDHDLDGDLDGDNYTEDDEEIDKKQ